MNVRSNGSTSIRIVDDIASGEGLEAIRHEGDDSGSPRTYLTALASDHLALTIYYWHRPGDWWAYNEHATRFNLALIERFEASGIEFAFPTRTVHLASDAGGADAAADEEA